MELWYGYGRFSLKINISIKNIDHLFKFPANFGQIKVNLNLTAQEETHISISRGPLRWSFKGSRARQPALSVSLSLHLAFWGPTVIDLELGKFRLAPVETGTE